MCDAAIWSIVMPAYGSCVARGVTQLSQVPGLRACTGGAIQNDGGASVSLWRSVFARHAWEQIEPIETRTGKPMGQGSTIAQPSEEPLALLTAAYQSADENTAKRSDIVSSR